MREAKTNGTSVQITDLQPFTVYTFRVSAVNALGPSPPSLTSYALATMREGE
jgi:receptor-type tyrosine-protein phosphatase gamma